MRTRSRVLCGINDTWRNIPDRQSPNVHVVAPRHSLHHPSSLTSPLAPSIYHLHLPVSSTSLLYHLSPFPPLLAPPPPPPPPTYLTHSARETQTPTMPPYPHLYASLCMHSPAFRAKDRDMSLAFSASLPCLATAELPLGSALSLGPLLLQVPFAG
jgi:hypothetical protein